jgi:hypothetical protein
MLIWLSGNQNGAPNENYARELMELFTLGADRPGGYTETDVREQARALTGWRNDYANGTPYNFRFDPSFQDQGSKTIFGRSGNFDWRDACRLCVQHPNHASYFVRKLWSYFVRTAPDGATQDALERLYRDEQYAVRPLVESILRHPTLRGPADGEAARRLYRLAPAPARTRDRHERLGLARRHGRAAALLPAERRRLGRLALARHRHVPRGAGRSPCARSRRRR